MAVFSSAPLYKPVSPKKKAAWNIHAQRAKVRNQLRLLADENARLQTENSKLKMILLRLQQENDDLWREVGIRNATGDTEHANS